MLDIATDRSAEARILVIHLRGRIDALTAREFDEFFEDLLQTGERFFVLRGNHLEYVSSAGIGSLVKFVNRLRSQGGAAVFVHLAEEIRLLLDFFGLADLVPVFDSLEAAQAHLGALLVSARPHLEIKRETILRERTYPERNRQRLKRAQQVHNRREVRLRSAPDVYARPLDRSGGHAAGTDEFGDSYSDGPTDSELEILSEAGPTDSELELMSEGGPTDSELELLSEGGPTESERELMSESSLTGMDFRRQSEALDGAGAALANSRLVVCEQCALSLRVYKAGPHMCPACGIEFDVRPDAGVSFSESP